MKKQSANFLLLTTIGIALIYQILSFINLPEILHVILGTVWNLVFAFIAGYYLVRKDFLNQFKYFNFKSFAWGLPLVLLSGMLFSFLYSLIFGQPTSNAINDTLSVKMILFQVPFMLMGEELLSTNILIALQKKGLSFFWSTIICSILFAFWHIPAYGFHPIQLIFTLAPARLALNYVWKKSSSVWVSWICHFIYDSLGFIIFFLK